MGRSYMYKPSKYNYFYTTKDGIHIIHNFMTNCLSVLEDHEVESAHYLLENCNHEENDETLVQLKNQFINNKYIIDEETDELAIIRAKNMMATYGSEVKRLVIMPTMDCNFACKYCFEKRETGLMGPHIIHGIKKWAEINSKSSKGILVSWFGGEPLLAKGIIAEINSYLKEKAAENGCHFDSSIVTNGYLIDEEFLSKIDMLGIGHFQITIDGPPESHNYYRPLRNGAGTFEVVFHNFLGVLESSNAMVNLRVNLTADNIAMAPQLINMIPPEYINSKKLNIFFKGIFAYNDDFEKYETEKIKDYEQIKKLYDYTINNGYGNLHMFSSRPYSCDILYKELYCIGPDGTIYKCTLDFYSDRNKIGFINQNGDFELDFNKQAKWFAHVAGDAEQCANCVYLPVCNGGCRLQWLKNGTNGCVDERKNLDSVVEALYHAALIKKAEKTS